MAATTADRVVVELTADTAKFTRSMTAAADAAERQQQRIRAAAQRTADMQMREVGKNTVGTERIFITYRNVPDLQPPQQLFGEKLILGYHKAINYLNKDGIRFVMEGFPEHKTESSIGNTLHFLNEEVLSTAHDNTDSEFGRITAQATKIEPPIVGTKDDLYHGLPEETLLEGYDLSGVFQAITRDFEARVAEGYEYRPLSNNSNTIVDQVLRDLALPPSLEKDNQGNAFFAPGSNKDLEKPGASAPKDYNPGTLDSFLTTLRRLTTFDPFAKFEDFDVNRFWNSLTGGQSNETDLEKRRQELIQFSQSPHRSVAEAAKLDLELVEDAINRNLETGAYQPEGATQPPPSPAPEPAPPASVLPTSASSAGFLSPGIFQDQPALFGLPVEPIGTGAAASAPGESAPIGGLAPSLLADQAAYNALLDQGRGLTAGYSAALEALRVQQAQYDEQLKVGILTKEEHAKAEAENAARQKELGGAITAVGDVFVNGIKGAADFNDALDSIGLGLLDLAIKGLFGQGALGGVFNQLLGNESGAAGILGALIAPATTSSTGGGGGGGGGIGDLLGSALSWLSGLFGGGLAAGGQALPGKLYQVGEAGREWFAPSVPGQVIPNSAIKAAAGGGGGSSQPIVFNISMAGANGDRAIHDIAARAVKTGLAGVPEINRRHQIRFA